MGLNIKDERVHTLAQRAARLTGRTQTGAIEQALERLIAEHEQTQAEAARQERIDLLWQEIQRDTTDSDGESPADVMHDLYDDAGLPK